MTHTRKLLGTRQRMGAAAVLMTAGALLSRFMGLIRDKIISWQFGAGAESDMYFAAFVIPDMINFILVGGFITVTAMPLLTRSFQENEEDGWRFFSCIFCWLLSAVVFLTAISMLAAEPLARIIAPGFTPEKCVRLAFFMRIVLPAQIFFLTGACFTVLLYMRRQFTAPALAPLIYNICIISCGVSIPLLFNTEGMTGYCVGVTLGAFIGAFLLPMRVAKSEGLRLRLTWRHPLMGRLLLLSLPLMLGLSVVMLDEQFLRIFGSKVGDGVVSLLYYARRIAQVPVGLLGATAAVASYPFLVNLLASGDHDGFERTLRSTLYTLLALVIPCAVWMSASAWPILCVIFQGGRFSPDDTLATVLLTHILLAATPFWIVYSLLARAYYAHGNTVTPAVIGTVVSALCLPFYFWAVPRGPWALAAVSTISVSLYVLWLMRTWKKRFGAGAFAGLGPFCFRAVGCALPGGALSYWISNYCLINLSIHPVLAACIALTAGGCAFALTFLPLAHIFVPLITQTCLQYLKKFLPKTSQQ